MDRIAATRAFLRAVETGSFSRVAAEQGTTQPTISKQVAALEAHLGVQLLMRSTRALSLTEEGRRYYEAASEAVEALEAAEAAARGGGAAEGRLRVGCPVSFGQAVLVALLPELLARHPALDVELVMSDAFLDPVEHGVDVVLRIGVLRDSALRARRVGTTRRIAVAAPSYLDARGTPERPEDLRGHDCLVYTRLATGAEWPFREGERTRLVAVSGRVRADSSAAMRTGVLAGLGVALLPSWLVAGDVAAGRLRAVLVGHAPEPLPMHVVSPPRRHTPPKVAAFADHVAEAFRADPELRP